MNFDAIVWTTSWVLMGTWFFGFVFDVGLWVHALFLTSLMLAGGEVVFHWHDHSKPLRPERMRVQMVRVGP